MQAIKTIVKTNSHMNVKISYHAVSLTHFYLLSGESYVSDLHFVYLFIKCCTQSLSRYTGCGLTFLRSIHTNLCAISVLMNISNDF